MNKKCENCIHFEVCKQWGYLVLESFQTALDSLGKSCSNFEDKSLVAKFTFKPNDIIYRIDRKKDQWGCYTNELITIEDRITDCFAEFDRGEPIVRYESYCYPHQISPEDIGKTVFATKKACEKEVKKLNKSRKEDEK